MKSNDASRFAQAVKLIVWPSPQRFVIRGSGQAAISVNIAVPTPGQRRRRPQPSSHPHVTPTQRLLTSADNGLIHEFDHMDVIIYPYVTLTGSNEMSLIWAGTIATEAINFCKVLYLKTSTYYLQLVFLRPCATHCDSVGLFSKGVLISQQNLTLHCKPCLRIQLCVTTKQQLKSSGTFLLGNQNMFGFT